MDITNGLPRPVGAEQAAAAPEQPMERRVTAEVIARGRATMDKYRAGKAALNQRIIDDELFWSMRHWEAVGRSRRGKELGYDHQPRPTSAWLFSSVTSFHADMMDNTPETLVRPRELSDRTTAQQLQEILPVVQALNGYGDTYSRGMWDKAKHGTFATGVFWDPGKLNGLGDISIQRIDLLRMDWEPGINHIQDSANLFISDLMDMDVFRSAYPELAGRMRASTPPSVPQYIYQDAVDISDKIAVYDWYYKVYNPQTHRTVLQYIKFADGVDEPLYASEDDPAHPEYRETGYYEHGMYPVVMDVLYPDEGTPTGFGKIAICKDPQLYIDRLSASVMEHAIISSKVRYFSAVNTNISVKQLLDVEQPIVDVNGEVSDKRLRPIEAPPMDPGVTQVLTQKIDELKETSGSRDVSNGGTTGGVTAYAAIAALQEAGSKGSRDAISGSYRAKVDVDRLTVELLRQFYTTTRVFRVTLPNGSAEQDGGESLISKFPGAQITEDGDAFVPFSNEGLRLRPSGEDEMGNILYRKPEFDYEIRAAKKSPFSRAAQNQEAKELFGAGVFNPELATPALTALSMMDFDGKDEVEKRVQEGQTLYKMLEQQSQQIKQLMGVVTELRGRLSGLGAVGGQLEQASTPSQPV